MLSGQEKRNLFCQHFRLKGFFEARARAGKELPQKLLRELLRNAKQSDRQLAKRLEVSQPTIARARHRLEKNGMIQDYTVTPDFRRMGFELWALTFVKINSDLLTPEMWEKGREYAAKWPGALLISTGEGLGMNIVVLSFHKDYSDFHRKLNQVRFDWKDYFQDIQTFIISLEAGDFKPFSLTYLKDTPH